MLAKDSKVIILTKEEIFKKYANKNKITIEEAKATYIRNNKIVLKRGDKPFKRYMACYCGRQGILSCKKENGLYTVTFEFKNWNNESRYVNFSFPGSAIKVIDYQLEFDF